MSNSILPSDPKIDPTTVDLNKVDPSVIEAETKAEKTSSSKGERLFDWLTYGGIAGLGTFALTIPIAYWAKYGGGAKAFVDAGKRLERMGMNESTAEHFMMTTATMQGGNVTIIPVKLMENHKPELVDKFNKMLGDKSEDASVENDPKQTWTSLIKARLLLAWLPVFVSFKATGMMIGEEKFGAFQNSFAESVCNFLKRPTHTPGLEKIVANETKIFRYGKIAALDVFATVAATSLLYIGSRFFAKQNEPWHAQRTHIQPPINPLGAPGKAMENATHQSHSAPAREKEPEPEVAIDKRFADTVPPRPVNDIMPKPRAENFTQTIASQKAAATEATPSLSA